MANVSILTIGDSNFDTFLQIDGENASLLCNIEHQDCEIAFKYGEKIPVSKIFQSFGGSALNTAIGFSRMTLSTSIATILGCDNTGDSAVAMLKKNLVDTSCVIQENDTNQASIILYKKERTIFSYHAPRDYSHIKLPQRDWIYFASANRGSQELVSQIVSMIENGAKLVFNPGSWQLENFEKFKRIIEKSEAIILNRSEADLIVGDSLDVKKQLEKLIALGAKIAIITDGANGAYIRGPNKKFHVQTLAVEVVDTTGAGDAFSAGFVGGLAFGHSIEESAKWGMVNSAAVIEKIGANGGLQCFGAIATRAKAVLNEIFTEL